MSKVSLRDSPFISNLSPLDKEHRLYQLAMFSCAGVALGLMVSNVLVMLFSVSALCCYALPRFSSAIPKVLAQPVVWTCIGLFSLFVLGAFWGDVPAKEAWIDGVWKYRKLLWGLLFVPFLMDRDIARRAAQAWFGIVGLTLLFIFLKFQGISIVVDSFDRSFAVNWIFRDYINTGLLVSLTIFFGFVCTREKTSWTTFGVMALMLMLHNVYLNQSRSAYVVSLGVLLAYGLRLKGFKWLLAGALSVGLAIVSIKGFNPYSYGFTGNEVNHSNHIRIELAQNTLKMIEAHPWLGNGTGTFENLYYENYGIPSNYPWPSKTVPNPHCEYLHIAQQLGVIGLFAYWLWLLAPLFFLRHLSSNSRLALEGLIYSMILFGFVNGILYGTVVSHCYMFALAWFIAEDIRAKRQLEKP